MADEDDTIEDAIEEAALDGIQRASGDQGSVDKVPLKDLIEADRYLTTKRATASGGLGGLRFFKVIPPGAE